MIQDNQFLNLQDTLACFLYEKNNELFKKFYIDNITHKY